MILEQLTQVWNGILDVTSLFVLPDWGALIGLLPVLILVGVIGPVLTLVVLGWLVYLVRRPRQPSVVVATAEPVALGSRLAGSTLGAGSALVPIGEPAAADGSTETPVGLPYCTHDRLVHASGATRCMSCGGDLTVVCPMCGIGRSAGVTTCGNCGLVLRIEARPRLAAPNGPPPGGAAVA